METRCEDVREPFSFVPSDQPCRSRDIQATDTMAVASTDGEQKECGLRVSVTSITLSRGPIPADIAQGLAVYRRKIDPESSPRDSPPLGASSSNSCARVHPGLPQRDQPGVGRESLIIVRTEEVPEMIVFQADPLLAENAVPVRSVSLICPSPSAVRVEIRSSMLACPPTAATVETQSSNLICPSVVTVETELANMLSPAAVTVEADSYVVTCPPTAVTDEIMAHVSVCLSVVSLEETSVPSVQLPPPTTALTEETQSQSAPPCLPTLTAAGDIRTSFLVYLSLPVPELANTPGLVCQLGLGQEEAKSLPFLCVPMSSVDIPSAPSLVAASPAPAQTVASAPDHDALQRPGAQHPHVPGLWPQLPPRSQSSHGGLQTHHMAEPRCPAHNLGTSFPQPQSCYSDPVFHFPQQYRLRGNPLPGEAADPGPVPSPVPTPAAAPQLPALVWAPGGAELSRVGSSRWVPVTNEGQNQGGVEQKDSIRRCASLHSKGSDTHANTNQSS
ncbi:unnamed protein product [Coregonus sp. 'balchen']|nr:unnamed protein product [Coregonus sp. 'balchen']